MGAWEKPTDAMLEEAVAGVVAEKRRHRMDRLEAVAADEADGMGIRPSRTGDWDVVRPRGPDRRQGPRREAERHLHYAEVNLHAAAVAWAEARRQYQEGGKTASLSIPYGDASERLADAAAEYRRVEEAAR